MAHTPTGFSYYDVANDSRPISIPDYYTAAYNPWIRGDLLINKSITTVG